MDHHALASKIKLLLMDVDGVLTNGKLYYVPDSAGRLVESAGLKGMRLGSAQVSTKHANFIQADKGGSADDVWRLVEHVRAEVLRRQGVDLVPEVHMVGFATARPSTSGRG